MTDELLIVKENIKEQIKKYMIGNTNPMYREFTINADKIPGFYAVLKLTSWRELLVELGLKKQLYEDITCGTCGKKFKTRTNEKRKYCSKSCSASFNNKIHKLKTGLYVKNKICRTCDNLTDNRNSYYCSDLCTIEYNMKHKIVNRSTRIGRSKIADNAMRYIEKLVPVKECKSCGYNKYIDVCHIKAVKLFPLNSTLAEINHKDNLVYLCPNCHWEFDNGYLKL